MTSKMTSRVTPDGERVIETTTDKDDVQTDVIRDADLGEQLEALKDQVREQVVRMINQARSGEASVSGDSITIKLKSH